MALMTAPLWCSGLDEAPATDSADEGSAESVEEAAEEPAEAPAQKTN